MKPAAMISKVTLGLGISLIVLFSFAFIVPSFAASAQSGQYAAYTVTATTSVKSFSGVVNETVSPSSTSGRSDLTLQVISSSFNFSISKLVNSSLAMLPYLPSIGNQSFSYQGHNFTASVSLVKTGTGTATVSGTSYTITNYSFQVSGSKVGGVTRSVSGELSALPSGLVYSATVNANNFTLQAHLVGTNAALSASTSSSTSAPLVIGASVGAIAAGVGLIALYRRRNASCAGSDQKEEKPLYHVD
ncbi:MAG: hypothetical protein ACYCPW_02365 [Nitrososphaerales archaeon]